MRSIYGMLAILVICPTSSAIASNAEHPWTMGVGASIAGTYKYGEVDLPSGSYDQAFGARLAPSFSMGRRLGSHNALQMHVEYTSQENSDLISARMASLSVGFRRKFHDHSTSPYLELAPALYAARWEDELSSYSLTSIRPGLVAALGLESSLSSRWTLDVALRAHASAGWPEVGHLPSGEPDYRGVRRLSLGSTISYSL